MPPSQLKRLKASLREKGITGPQKSKKRKRQERNDGTSANQRAPRAATLAGIRESLNPFEIKALARPQKFSVTTNKPSAGKLADRLVGRPGVTKSLGEEARRKTLLPELNRRNKVGGILDRRIGENDPTMTPEQKMLERFTREKSRKKGASLFNLEEENDEEALTHMGQTLEFQNATGVDDFDAGSLAGSSEDEDDDTTSRKRKRVVLAANLDGADEGEANQPERKKSRAEIYQEIIAKSKLHKYERQQIKEQDQELREELDKGLPDLLAALRGQTLPKPLPTTTEMNGDPPIHPERASLIAGIDAPLHQDKNYDIMLKQMALEKRAQPTERTKTTEERAEKEARRLKELEEQRLRRMKGEESEDETHVESAKDEDDPNFLPNDAADFGLSGHEHSTTDLLGVEDEDEFVLDQDLIASDVEDEDISGDSDLELLSDNAAQDDDDEFIADILTEEEKQRGAFKSSADKVSAQPSSFSLPYTYPCPSTCQQLEEILMGIPESEYHTVIQRIRALYHPQLHAENKEKLSDFSVALVDYISHMACQKSASSLATIETLIRHIHSLSRTYPDRISRAFRSHLQSIQEKASLSPGDLVIFTAIGSIYPTSDHFHQVVTPAIILMARWLGLTTPQNPRDFANGVYLVALCLSYQKFSKRYMPELVRFSLLALKHPGISKDMRDAYVKGLLSAAEIWTGNVAFTEIFSEVVQVLTQLNEPEAAIRLRILLHQSQLSRRPLKLHHHRPLPIKTHIPKFEDDFNPDKHYDPDRDRAESKKLQAEYKRERKGALRELRKDASFVSREKLKEKKERDRAYEEKYRKLVAEIQGEEGREKNAYSREKKLRKAKS